MATEPQAKELALAALDAAAQAQALHTVGPASRVAFAALYKFVTDPGFSPPPGFSEALAGDAKAAADVEGLLRKFRLMHMPRLAAASDGAARRRVSDAATLTLTPSRARQGQLYVVLELTDPAASAPRQLMVRQTGGGWLRRALAQFADGRMQLLVEEDDPLIAALSDPEAEVYLV